MLFPKTGRVIIIDDKVHHATPLISALSRNNIPSSYFNARTESFPINLIDDARLMFLDINLTEGNLNWDTEKAALIQNVISTIEPDQPYVLFIWSVNETSQFADVVTLFENELKRYKPLVTPIALGKSQLFKLVDPETDQWDLELGYEGTIKFISEKIAVALNSIDGFEPLVIWENLVAKATAQVTNEIVSLASKKDDLNTELKKIYFKLAEAMYGRQLGSETNIIANKALNIFHSLLVDKLEYNSGHDVEFKVIKDIKAPDRFEEKDKAKFNSKLLLSFPDMVGVFPGNAYAAAQEEIEKAPFNALLADSILVPLVAKEFFLSQGGDPSSTIEDIMKFKKEKNKDYDKFEKGVREAIKSSSGFVRIEVSPLCDYAQKKWKLSRVCPAILWSEDFKKYIGRSDNLYESPILLRGTQCFRIVLDFRYMTSVTLESFSNVKPIFRLKHSFLTDIQSGLARHVNRPGITSLK
jgi:hypothetical protein